MQTASVAHIRRALDALPIFPLPNVVLMPHAPLPLHVFEPRYQALVNDAMAGEGLMAIALLEPGWEENYDGVPPVRSVACVGEIVAHEALHLPVHAAALLRVQFGPGRHEQFIEARVIPECVVPGHPPGVGR